MVRAKRSQVKLIYVKLDQLEVLFIWSWTAVAARIKVTMLERADALSWVTMYFITRREATSML
jgi:hypothetical protein